MSEKDNKSITDWLGISNAPNWRVALFLGPAFSVVVGLLFALALLAAFAVLLRMVFAGDEVTLGAGALVAALLGAPFVIWGTILKHQTVMFQKEGHMTDRISRAVEQLGAEKIVKKIIDGKAKETSEPNIEVRIGAILSLERIAQDSTRHDKGRDHVRVMEILCAYIRENSVRREPENHSVGAWQTLGSNSNETDRQEFLSKSVERFGDDGNGIIKKWAQDLKKPDADISLALRVIGRRSREQRQIEAAWRDAKKDQAVWPFICKVKNNFRTSGRYAGSSFNKNVEWRNYHNIRQEFQSYRGYRIDLRGAYLQGADFSSDTTNSLDMDYSGARLEKARLEGANLSNAVLNGTNLIGANLEGAICKRTSMLGANLTMAKMEGVDFSSARLDGVVLFRSELQGARLSNSNMCCANLRYTCLDWVVAKGAFLAGASLEKATLVGANFERAVLKSARLMQVNCSRANFTEATMSGVEIRSSRCELAVFNSSDMSSSDLSCSDFHGAMFNSVKLVGARLIEVRFSKVSATCADFSGAELNSAQLDSTNLQYANFNRAVLNHANLFDSILDGCGMQAANLTYARFQYASFWGSLFDRETILSSADFFGAKFKELSLVDTLVSSHQIKQTFGDITVEIDEGISRPAHWANENLSQMDFFEHWKAWLDACRDLKAQPHAD